MAHLPHLNYHRLPGETHDLVLTLTTTAGEGPQDAADVSEAHWDADTLGLSKTTADGITVTDDTDADGNDAITFTIPVDRADTLTAVKRQHRWTLDVTDTAGDRYTVFTGSLDLRTRSPFQRV